MTLDEAVEAIRVASFEAPKAGSHTEWARRIKEILTCPRCGWPWSQHACDTAHIDGRGDA